MDTPRMSRMQFDHPSTVQARMRSIAFALFFLVADASIARSQNVVRELWIPDGEVNALALSGPSLYLGGTFKRLGPPLGGALVLDPVTAARLDPFPKVTGTILTAESDGEGGWFIGGSFEAIDGVPHPNLAHIRGDLTVDGWDPGLDGAVRTLSRVGSILYVGGDFLHVLGNSPRSFVAAFTTDGDLVSAFNAHAEGVINVVRATASAVYVGGNFNSIGGATRPYLGALDPVSGVALNWVTDPNGLVTALEVEGSALYVAGSFTFIGGQSRTGLAAVATLNGQATSWNPPAPSARVRSLVVQGSAAYLAGDFTSVGGVARDRVAAIDLATGTLLSWAPAPNGPVHSLATDGSTVWLAGEFNQLSSTDRIGLAAVDATTGALLPWDPYANGPAYAALHDGARLFAGGGFTSMGGVPRNHLACIDLATGEPTAWNPDVDATVHALAATSTTLYAGGLFDWVSGGAQVGVARRKGAAWNLSDGTLLPWNPNVDGTIHTLVLGPSSIYLGGDFFLAGGKTRTNLAELDLVTAQATTWAPPVGPIVHALAPGVVGAIYTAGTFTSPMNHLASCNFFSGSVVPNWNPDANGDVNALVVSGSRVIIGGAFTIVHGTQKWRLAALETDIPGLPVDSWNHDFLSGEVNALAVNGPVLYAGGTFPEGNGLAAMDVATGTGLSWDPRLGGGRVNALLVDGPTLYVAGTFKRIARHAQQGVAAITSSVVSVAQGPAPNEIQLGIPFPNPTSQGVTVELGLPSPASVSVAVYDVRGRRVMRWAPRPYGESRARVTWDGRDGAGRAVAPGLYFLEVNVGDRSLKRRIAIVR